MIKILAALWGLLGALAHVPLRYWPAALAYMLLVPGHRPMAASRPLGPYL